jgi:hypothetical protein
MRQQQGDRPFGRRCKFDRSTLRAGGERPAQQTGELVRYALAYLRLAPSFILGSRRIAPRVSAR